MKKILITGGTGLVGDQLTKRLISSGYEVVFLSRSDGNEGGVQKFKWDINKEYLDLRALENVDAVIHLAGAGVADKPWSKARKEEILESRTKGTALLYRSLSQIQNKPEVVVCASAIGYYGSDESGVLVDENSPKGTDFLAKVTVEWEKEQEKIKSLGIRLVQLRIGLVLAKQGGALPKLAQPLRLGAGVPLGSGKQYQSWIHIDDLVEMFCFGLENQKVQGAYNAVAPNPVTHHDLLKAMAKKMGALTLPFHAPSFLLKAVLGEMAEIVLLGKRVSSGKIQKEGFEFKFEELKDALADLL